MKLIKDKISVVMGIYNCKETLAEAIDSILAQTYTNWELIICDDASSDGTISVAEAYTIKHPDKIKLLKNNRNMGLHYTLNKCLGYAQGEYIARMDGDDISLPERFEKEIEILQRNQEISIVSSVMILFDESGDWGKTRVVEFPREIDLLYGTPFGHGASMVRYEAYRAVNGYSVEAKSLRVEDYLLWVKMYKKGFRGMNIQQPLYKLRDDNMVRKRRKFKYRFHEAYVKGYVIKHLKFPFYKYIYCLKPILLAFCPNFIYKWLHQRKYRWSRESVK